MSLPTKAVNLEHGTLISCLCFENRWYIHWITRFGCLMFLSPFYYSAASFFFFYFTPNISKVLDLLNPIFTTCSRVDIDLFSIFTHFPIQGTSEGEILCFEMPSHGSEIKLVQSLQGKKLIQLNNFE